MYAMHTDGWESVLEMAVDVYRPDNVEGGHDRPVLVSFYAAALYLHLFKHFFYFLS